MLTITICWKGDGVAVEDVIVKGTYFTIGFTDEVPAIVPVVFVTTFPAGVE
jgi:hypothetical protein